MNVECPHCHGEIGFVADLVGKRVGCPHCQQAFVMPPEIPAAVDKPPNTATEKKPPGVQLLESLVEQQIATNKLLTQLLSSIGTSRQYLYDLKSWMLIFFIILVLGGCVGMTTIVKYYP
jgi:hypothetical protein